MARGAESKAKVIQTILETFDGAFEYGKELRIPIMENGERVEIKVTLTCAKTNVGGDDGPVDAAPAAASGNVTAGPPTEEEKQNIANLLDRLGI